MTARPASTSLAKSLQRNAPSGRDPGPVDVRRLTQPKIGPVPGEGEVHPGIGAVHQRSAKAYADAVGVHFGGTRATYRDD
jgi:hypothetical protein